MSITAPSVESSRSESVGQHRPLLVPSSELRWRALTIDQAQVLYEVIHEQREDIKRRWSAGVYEGLSVSLCDIERAGGAYIRQLPQA